MAAEIIIHDGQIGARLAMLVGPGVAAPFQHRQGCLHRVEGRLHLSVVEPGAGELDAEEALLRPIAGKHLLTLGERRLPRGEQPLGIGAAVDRIGGLDERIKLRAVGLAGGRPVRSRRRDGRHRRRRHDKNRTPDQAQPHPTTPRHYSFRTEPANRLFT